MQTAIDHKARDRIRRAAERCREEYVMVVSPDMKETVEVSVTTAKELLRGSRSEHGLTAPVTITYRRETARHGDSVRHFHSFEEFEEGLHEH